MSVVWKQTLCFGGGGGGGKKISVLQVYVTFDKNGIFKETR